MSRLSDSCLPWVGGLGGERGKLEGKVRELNVGSTKRSDAIQKTVKWEGSVLVDFSSISSAGRVTEVNGVQ